MLIQKRLIRLIFFISFGKRKIGWYISLNVEIVCHRFQHNIRLSLVEYTETSISATGMLVIVFLILLNISSEIIGRLRNTK